MSETLVYFLIVIFSLLSLVLIGVIFHISRKMRSKKQAVQQQQRQHEQIALDNKRYLIDSIRVIARSILDKQCPMIEGCIRLKVLIDNYAPQLHQQDEVQIIELIYAKTAHIPTLKGWKALSKVEKQAFQSEMDSLEQGHASQILSAAQYLKEFPFEQRLH